ncbi:hypothetical protein [Actinacidiphila glaucinigra]|uniref:Uncharacterized protein n=1 Tax=Actinacidiphila glaucinigra TaxID=235986 RepID=A0A238ZQI2_9ACTN|nr:hypothetical protein [Actinacidiphila glaucinigra]SNR85449.1 hypothetical protein SAMN05216252_101467 [Actinacidiphila glaucinigra]
MLLPVAAAPIEFVEAVRVTADLFPRPRTVPGDTIDVWVEDEARHVLGLLGEVPEGERARCFVPGYAVRAHSAHEVLFEVALCFRCNGALLLGPLVPAELRGIQAFDAGSAPGRELLRRFQEAAATADRSR